MRTVIIIGSILILAGAFIAGRGAGASKHRAAPSAAASAVPASPTRAATGHARREIRRQSLAAPDQATLAETALEPAAVEETPQATAARRAETNARLTEELGAIPAEQRAQLVDVNDRAIEFQRRLTGELERGTIDHEEYMRRFHEEMIAQLDELHGLLSDDQYRTLTGLEPGVDPYDFMKTGEGGAPGSSVEEPPLGAAEARMDKQLPGTTGGEVAP